MALRNSWKSVYVKRGSGSSRKNILRAPAVTWISSHFPSCRSTRSSHTHTHTHSRADTHTPTHRHTHQQRHQCETHTPTHTHTHTYTHTHTSVRATSLNHAHTQRHNLITSRSEEHTSELQSHMHIV